MALPTLTLNAASAESIRQSAADQPRGQQLAWIAELLAAAEELLTSIPSWPVKGSYHGIVTARSRPKNKSSEASKKQAKRKSTIQFTTLQNGASNGSDNETGVPSVPKDGPEKPEKERFGWHSRQSVHGYDWSAGQTYEGFWAALGQAHTEREKEYVHDLKAIHKLETFDLGPGIKAEAWLCSYKLGFPTSNRDFVQLVITIDATSTTPTTQLPVAAPSSARSSAPGSPHGRHEHDSSYPFLDGGGGHTVEPSAASGAPLLSVADAAETKAQSQAAIVGSAQTKNYAGSSEPPPLPKGPMRSFINISVPITHPDAPERGKEGFVRGKYVSVEKVEEEDPAKDEAEAGGDGGEGKVNVERKRRIKWTVATSSDPGGLVPPWIVDASMPKTIAADVPVVLKWIRNWRQGKVRHVDDL